MDTVIRGADAADLGALAAIGAAAGFSWNASQLADSLAIHRVLVLEDDEGIAGFLVYSRALDEVELLNVAVDPARQGRGYGAALVARLLDDNRGHAARVLLEVRVSNARAIALYQRFGFTRVGVRKGYYPALQESPAGPQSPTGREDAWIMAHDY